MVSSALTDYAYYLEIFYVVIAHTIALILSLTELELWLAVMKLRYIDAWYFNPLFDFIVVHFRPGQLLFKVDVIITVLNDI